MSHTPIYDELRELRLSDSAVQVAGAHGATIRLVVPNADVHNVDQLANRRGLGGRHRRPSG